MTETRSPILQGTLDLMVLKTLDQLGPLHGYGIARRIEQVGENALALNQGTVHLCLVRLLQRKWISGKWPGAASCRPRPIAGSASPA
jgi:PadR family transcriptional regulator PadR